MSGIAIRTARPKRISPIPRYVCLQCRRYAIPTPTDIPATPPPLLIKLRKDLKTAMQEKDTNRLNVLRSIIADVTNSAKANKPINSDMQLVSILRKRQAAAKAASEEFKAAGRIDLVEKEEGQVDVLEQYAGSVETLSGEDLRDVVVKAMEDAREEHASGAAKVNMGDVLKRLLGPGGKLDGQPVDKKEVAKIVKEVMTPS